MGFEQFLPYLLGEKDGQPKDAAWAEKLTGIDAETIRGLARQMAANRTQIIAGWCVQRMQHGEQWAWMIVVLAAMLGQIGLPGGGFGFGWHYNGAGTPGRKGVILVVSPALRRFRLFTTTVTTKATAAPFRLPVLSMRSSNRGK